MTPLSLYIKSQPVLLFNAPEYTCAHENLFLLRIWLHPDFTRFDLGYQATSYYIRGGWVNISQHTQLLSTASKNPLQLLSAEKIPYAPNHHHFEAHTDWLYFRLYFEAIPYRNQTLEMLENNLGNEDDFNISSIKLNLKDGCEVVDMN